jgi:hypothetical protein
MDATVVTITDSVIAGNSATCLTCSGGGLLMAAGGLLTLHNTTVVNNACGQFGGGVALGDPTDGAVDTCSVLLSGATVLANNTSQFGVGQLSSICAGSVTLQDVWVAMSAGSPQVWGGPGAF